MVNKIAIASDHAGFELKQLLIESLSSDLEIEDLGTDSLEPCDFPDYATKVTAVSYTHLTLPTPPYV